MNSKIEYDLGKNLEKPSFTTIHSQTMKVLRLLDEKSEAYKECEKIFEVIEEQQKNLDDLKGLLYIIAGKM